MARYVTDTVYRLWMFFFVPLALVHLALPGRDPIRVRQRVRTIRAEKPTPDPVYLGPKIGGKPYRVEIGSKRPKPQRPDVGPKRHASHRQHGLAR